MPIYEVSALTTLVTATQDAPLCALRAVTKPLYVRELHVSLRTASLTRTNIGLTRSTALGTGTLTSKVGQARNPLVGMPAATGLLVTNWATLAPTVNANNYFRRICIPIALGNGFIWTFDPYPGLEVDGSASAVSELVLCNLSPTAPGTMEIIFVYEE